MMFKYSDKCTCAVHQTYAVILVAGLRQGPSAFVPVVLVEIFVVTAKWWAVVRLSD
jgi:hypothetical protein